MTAAKADPCMLSKVERHLNLNASAM